MATSPSPSTPTRRGRPQLVDLDSILDAGVRVGLEDLSPTTVARELGVDPSTLYRYVKNRNDLVERVMDRIMARLEAPDMPDADVRDYLAASAEQLWVLQIEHPGLAAYLLAGPSPTIDGMTLAMIEELERRGVSRPAGLFLVTEVGMYVLSWVHAHQTRRRVMSEGLGQSGPALPELRALVDAVGPAIGSVPDQRWFRWSVTRVIDGLVSAVEEDQLPWHE